MNLITLLFQNKNTTKHKQIHKQKLNIFASSLCLQFQILHLVTILVRLNLKHIKFTDIDIHQIYFCSRTSLFYIPQQNALPD